MVSSDEWGGGVVVGGVKVRIVPVGPVWAEHCLVRSGMIHVKVR